MLDDSPQYQGDQPDAYDSEQQPYYNRMGSYSLDYPQDYSREYVPKYNDRYANSFIDNFEINKETDVDSKIEQNQFADSYAASHYDAKYLENFEEPRALPYQERMDSREELRSNVEKYVKMLKIII